MKVILQLCLLSICVLAVFARIKTSDFTDEERWAATLQGVSEAKEHVESLVKSAKVQSKKYTAAQVLKKFFRRASPRSEAIGKARLHMEEAVKRTERILMEKKRHEVAKTASREEQAELIAQELYHKPGTLLSKKELSHIQTESGCEELRLEPDCSTVAFYHSVRTISGVCNNLAHPTQGASFTPFGRIIEPQYENGIDTLFNVGDAPGDEAFKGFAASARLISDTTITDREINDTHLTHLIMQWGQFMDHDLDLAVEFGDLGCDLESCEQTGNCAPVRVAGGDLEFGEGTPNDGVCLPFQRTIGACTENPFEFEPREQVNEITHYIDASNVYGSTDSRADFLREKEGGRLRVSTGLPTDGDNLPLQQNSANLGTELFCPPEEGPTGEVETDVEECCLMAGNFEDEGCFVAGDPRAVEHASLAAMHTVWVREHNRIARGLEGVNPQWDDDRIYIETRRIVIAEIQFITFNEYLPALFGQANFDKLIGPYIAYNPQVDASIPNAFATAAYRFGHSQIQPFFERLNGGQQSIPEGPLFLRDSFFSPTAYQESGGVTPIARGWLKQPARQVDEFLNSVLTSQLFEPIDDPGRGMDLATLNIQRGRDHGLPRYGTWRRFCEDATGLTSELRNDLTRIRIHQIYGSIDDADLFVGAMAEEPLPGSKLGATLSCIFAITFRNLRDGDRFWYENNSPDLDIFTDEQEAEIESTSISQVLCDNTMMEQAQQEGFKQSEELLSCLFQFRAGVKNFDLWREEPLCFFRMTVSTARTTSWFLPEIVLPNGQFEAATPVTDPGTSVSCVGFTCPTPANNVLIGTGVQTSRIPFCTVVDSSPALTVSGSATSKVVRVSDLSTANNGIYFNEAQCLTGGVDLVVYSCDGATQSATSQSKKNPKHTTAKMASTDELENELAKVLGEKVLDAPKKSGKNRASVQSQVNGIDVITLNEMLDEDNPNLDPMLLEMIRSNTGSQAAQKSSKKVEAADTAETSKLINLLKATLQELKDEN